MTRETGSKPATIPLWVSVLVIAGDQLTTMGTVIALARAAILISPEDLNAG
jgi:hypothetical protein